MNLRLLVLGLPALLGACGRLGFYAQPDDPGDANDAPHDAAPATTRAISTGRSHSCAIHAGALACWGDNTSGQLGVGDLTQRLSAVAVDPTTVWIAVACGALHTCAVKANGSLWCWGENMNGEVGLGAAGADVLTPMPVTLAAAVRMLASTYESTCAVLVDGSLWCWGVNSEGQLGQDTAGAAITSPVRVGSSTAWTQASVGHGHTLGVLGGSAMGTGRNTEAELGLGASAANQYRVMTLIDGGPWRTTSSGQASSLGIRADGSLWGWGENNVGALGFTTTARRTVPEQITGGVWTAAATNTFHGCGIVASGAMQCWGRNVEGQLGRGDTTFAMIPAASGTAVDWEAVAVARFHTCAQRRDGTVWCTGENLAGELGTGDVARRTAWTQVTLP